MRKVSMLLAAAVIAGSSTLVLAQAGGAGGEGPKPGDARPPAALKQGGIPPAAALRRGDDMAPANTGGVANVKGAKMSKKMKKSKNM